MSGLFAAGLILLAVAALADLAGGRIARFMGSGPLYLLGAAGSACLAVLGGFALAGRSVQLGVGGWLSQPVPGQPTAGLAADRLSGLFLALAFGAAVPVSVAFASWARSTREKRRGAGRELRTGARLGRGDRDGAGRVHLPVRLGGADARLLPAGRVRAAQAGTGCRGPAYLRVRQGQRGRAAGRAAAAGYQVALDHAGVVRARARRPGPDHRPGAAAGRLRDQGRAGAVPDLAAARLLSGTGPGPRDHGGGVRQRGLLRHVAHAGAARPDARLAGGRGARARRAVGAARHRPRGGAEPAVPGDRLLQRREQRAHRDRLRYRADRRGGR